jgi:hypothetical protein
MSVEDPRTAAAARVVRAFRLSSWLLILPTLSFLSFSAVASARGPEGKPDYAHAVGRLAHLLPGVRNPR